MDNKMIEAKIKKLLETYPSIYNESEYDYLNRIELDYLKKENTVDVLRQILEQYNYYKKEDSIYEYFINHLDNNDKLNKNIIEVGGGIIPTLAKKISLRQTNGTITVYDPRLSDFFNENEKFILKKEKFKRNTNINKADLLIGFMPCEATQQIIEAATHNNTDFIITMCEGGPHGEIYDYFEDEEEWLNSMICYASCLVEDNNMGKLKVLKIPSQYGISYPIIENQR